jgi:hypothetical protein
VYIFNADPYTALPTGSWERKHYYHVSGGLSGLHVLADSVHDPQSVTFIDIEEEQYEWVARVSELILAAPSFENFIQRMLCRSSFYGPQDRRIDPILEDHPWAHFLALAKPVGNRATRCYDPRPIQSLQLPIKRTLWGWNADTRIELGDEEFPYWIGIAPDGDYMPQYINCIYPGYGFHSREGYAKVRNILRTVPVRHIRNDVFALDYEPDALLYLSGVSRLKLPVEELEVEWIDCPWWINDHCYNDERSKLYGTEKQVLTSPIS